MHVFSKGGYPNQSLHTSGFSCIKTTQDFSRQAIVLDPLIKHLLLKIKDALFYLKGSYKEEIERGAKRKRSSIVHSPNGDNGWRTGHAQTTSWGFFQVTTQEQGPKDLSHPLQLPQATSREAGHNRNPNGIRAAGLAC